MADDRHMIVTTQDLQGRSIGEREREREREREIIMQQTPEMQILRNSSLSNCSMVINMHYYVCITYVNSLNSQRRQERKRILGCCTIAQQQKTGGCLHSK